MFKRIDHVEIVTADLDRAIAFYTGVLGFAVRERRTVAAAPLEEIAYLELGGTTLELMRVRDAIPAPDAAWRVGYRMVALEVDDMERAIAYLADRDVPLAWGPVTLGRSRRAEIRDPDGLPIELRQW